MNRTIIEKQETFKIGSPYLHFYFLLSDNRIEDVSVEVFDAYKVGDIYREKKKRLKLG